MSEAPDVTLSRIGVAARVQRVVRELALDLTDLAVGTEAATGPFAWTAAIAAAAGAREVRIVGRSSVHGSAATAVADTRLAAQAVAPDVSCREVTRDEALQADIVTNLGPLRPLDGATVSAMRPGTALPLMWETWEWRPDELDLAACVKHQVLVLGTNESHPAVRTMSYVGMIAVKLLLDAGEPVVGQQVVLIGGGPFVTHMATALEGAGARVSRCRDVRELAPGEPDAVIFADHESADMLVGEGGHLSAAAFASRVAGALIAHVSGAVDANAIRDTGLRLVPSRIAVGAHRMSVTAGYVGVEPVLRLHAAGLAVGAALARAWRAHGTLDGALSAALQSPVAQDFSAAQWRAVGRY